MAQYAMDMAYKLGLKRKEDYYKLIVNCMEKGRHPQMEYLFMQMSNYDKREFLNVYLKENITIQRACRIFCICELLKEE